MYRPPATLLTAALQTVTRRRRCSPSTPSQAVNKQVSTSKRTYGASLVALAVHPLVWPQWHCVMKPKVD